MRRNISKGDILTGNIPQQLMLFFMPIWFGTLFQQLYNTVDTVIVGNFVGTQALAAVGATGSFVQLLVGFFVGLCSGAGVIISQSYDARNSEAVNREVHTSLALAILGGAVLMLVGLAASGLVLRLMHTPEEIIGISALYLRVYFLGMIPQMLYNMGTNILRAVGDSKRPLYFLMIASGVNIALDILFVAALGMGVAGAALATVISQCVSAVLTIRCLAGSDGMPWNIEVSRLRIERQVLSAICRIGLPAAAQSSLYSISNIVIQTGINSFGTVAVAAWSVYGKIDFLFWMTVNSYGLSITTFAGQNFGAHQYDRVRRGVNICWAMAAATTVVISAVMYPLARPLFSLFSQDALVVEQGVEVMHFLVPLYITYISVEVLSGALRGCGDVRVPTMITVICVCLLRIVLLIVVVPINRSILMVEASYPITWGLSSILFIAYYLKGSWLKRRIAAQQAAEQMA